MQPVVDHLPKPSGPGRRGGHGRGLWCLVAASLLSAPPAAAAERGNGRTPDELVNVFVAPGYAQWLVGPIARLASEDEVRAYLAITDDAAAERFIDEFWQRREPMPDMPGLSARQQFEQLAEEADRQFGEATFRGRHTDRGTVFILYGPPDDVQHRPARPARSGRYRSPPMSSRHGLVERWLYRKARVGLDGSSPRGEYRFIREGDLTRLVKPARLP